MNTASSPSPSLAPLPVVTPNASLSYAISVLRDSIAYHTNDMATDPMNHRARIVELEAAIQKLQRGKTPAFWTSADIKVAAKQGWGVFNYDFNGGRYSEMPLPEIQRFDDEGRFEDDAAAIAFVKKMATEQNCPTSIRALAVCGIA